MILYLKELYFTRRTFFIWTLSIIIMFILMMAMFPSFANQGDKLNEMLKAFPEEMQQAFNMSTLDFSKAADYFAYIHPYIFLFACMQMMIAGSSILSKEEDSNTVEFLLSKPVSRNYVITSKFLSVVTQIIAFFIFYAGSAFILLEIFAHGEYEAVPVLLMCATLSLAQLLFAALGLLISVFVVKGRTSMSISVGTVLAAFFISMAVGVSEKLDALKYFTPFKYFDNVQILNNSTIEPKYLFITIAASVVFIVLTYILYNRKDISS